MEILSLLWIVRALHILETAGKIFEAAGKYRTEGAIGFILSTYLAIS